ncbi:hypothetical protein HMPREF1548_06460 [Clostridium sp. KLE 1755]|nr:hypothetical protein HMPREF1548_06460 [Clostridium sp. KLE 1755]
MASQAGGPWIKPAMPGEHTAGCGSSSGFFMLMQHNKNVM